MFSVFVARSDFLEVSSADAEIVSSDNLAILFYPINLVQSQFQIFSRK